jgi:hypothetical protein
MELGGKLWVPATFPHGKCPKYRRREVRVGPGGDPVRMAMKRNATTDLPRFVLKKMPGQPVLGAT